MGSFSSSLRSALALIALLPAWTGAAIGQELEPRSYSASPIGTNFLGGSFSLSKGDVSVDPSLPISDVMATVGTASIGFSHSFALGDRTASWALSVPYLGAHITGAVFGVQQATSRFGFSDMRARFALELLGRALTPAQFAQRKPRTSLGVSVSVSAPTGTYDPTRLINVGSNRWSIKPEIGLEQPMGRWFVDLSYGVWLFGTNTNYDRGALLTQSPLSIVQFHGGRNFRPGQWLAIDANHYYGGQVTAAGQPRIGTLSNSRFGFTYSQPMSTGFSTKLAWSHWLSGTYGQGFTTTTLTLQYRWFDHAR
jgi:hypothetical protein